MSGHARTLRPLVKRRKKDIGSVLCAAEIQARCEVPDCRNPLMKDWDRGCLVGAKYDLRMATTGLVLPGGKIIEPDEDPYQEEILLEPGETIFVSTQEKLQLPLDLVGNMSIKGELSRKGILSLTGLIVDPGYREGSSSDGRLHFRLANLGSNAVLLQPGRTKIASIQFLRLSGDATEPTIEFPNIWAHKEELEQGLGFIEDIKKVKARVASLSTEFERQKRNVNYVILVGMLVVLATLLGVSISGLLSLGADSDVVDSAKNVIPDDSGGQALAVVLMLGLSAIASATVIAFAHRSEAGGLAFSQRALAHEEALREEKLHRYRCMGIYLVVTLAAVTAAIAVPVALHAAWWIPCLAPFLVLVIAIAFSGRAWKPITPGDVKDRLLKWEKAEGARQKKAAGAAS